MPDLADRQIALPSDPNERPNREALDWHARTCFRDSPEYLPWAHPSSTLQKRHSGFTSIKTRQWSLGPQSADPFRARTSARSASTSEVKNQVSGSGTVRLGKDGRLKGKIRIKNGDESTFSATRADEPERPIPAPPSYRDKWRRR